MRSPRTGARHDTVGLGVRLRQVSRLGEDRRLNNRQLSLGPSSESASPRSVRVAIAAPIDPLWYEVPERLAGLVHPGVRVRVPVGRRSRRGIVIADEEQPPRDMVLKPVEEALDVEPILDKEQLGLAEFISDYYLAPIGEVLDGLIPADIPATRMARVRLTSQGALATRLSGSQSRLVQILLESGGGTVGELAERWSETQSGDRASETSDVLAAVRSLARRKLVRFEQPGSSRSARLTSAVELSQGSVEDLLERCGRSPKARAVVRVLAEEGRPRAVSEVMNAADCSRGVVSRLVKIGVLREFTQMRSLSLERHASEAGSTTSFELRADQRRAVGQVIEALDRRTFQSFLLRGVTGSGKTEVYLRAIEHTLTQHRTALVLVPEIALVPALAQELRQRFANAVALLHSNLGRAERAQEWSRVRSGDARIVVGPRSAALAPVQDLGLVVVDEEHDAAYKQSQKAPHYSGRDVALLRAQRAGAVAVLASATPSMEALGRVRSQQYRVTTLTERAGSAGMPTGEVVDLRQESSKGAADVHISERLDQAIRETTAAGQQVILLRNRRGFAPVVLCRACGEDHRCEDCGLPRTLHWKARTLICHYCGSSQPVPRHCTACGEAALEPVGAGTERVEAIVRERYPDLSVDVLDRDAAQRVGGAARILDRFARGDSQVLVGTQMVAKGHHFPNVTLTGVLAADTYLKFPDFRAVERTYALLTQVVGRSGRGDVPGRYVLQTFQPEHYAIRAVLEGDAEGFEDAELRFRRSFGYPPFGRLVSILIRDKEQDRGRAKATELAQRLESSRSTAVRINGPAPAPFEKLRGFWRFQLLLRAASHRALVEVLQRADAVGHDPAVRIDVDPQSLL